MTETDDYPTRDVTLTCGTEGCTNAGVALALTVPVDCETFVCGACSQPITDVT